ncbi:hypothetical protein F4212_04555 [Candidatus Poribacteria bacterium]|nr:hypothetical protein [Candidatus Poribacteria bacterium]
MKKILFLTVFILGFITTFFNPSPISSKGVSETSRCYDSPQWHLPEGVKARIGKGSIIKMQYSPDGNVLAVLSSVGIWLYDAHSGEERALLTGHTGLITNMSFSPNSHFIASGGMDGTTRIWDVATGKQKHTLTVPKFRIGDVSFSNDGKTLASVSISAMSKRIIGQVDPYIQSIGIAGTSSDIELWDVATGTHKETIKTGDFGSNILFSPDGKTIADGYDNNSRLWDAATGKLKEHLRGAKTKIRCMSFSPDGHAIAIGGWLEIHVWDTNIDKNKSVRISHPKQSLKGHTSYVNSLCFSPDSKTLVSGSEDKTIRLWDMATGKQKRILKGHRNSVNSISISPDGTTLASAYSHGPIRVWDVATGKQKQTFTNQALIQKQAGHELDPSSVAFSPDGQTLAVGNQDASILLWDANTGKHKQTLKRHSFLKRHTWKVTSVSFSPDGKTLASGSKDNNIR